MELKHNHVQIFGIDVMSLNRTFMELKLRKNWLRFTFAVCLNRTFMELKHVIQELPEGIFCSLNRTFMELKLKTCHIV